MTDALALKTVDVQWNVRIPVRDGNHLSAVVYVPRGQSSPSPAICALTPYIADHLHPRGIYFAARGFPFIGVDVRGRGNSKGEFRPYAHDALDGCDAIEWVLQQPFCNGKVGMCGGSYLGYVQWMIAAKFPSGLCAIAPTAAPCFGIDVPIRNNIFSLYMIRWLSIVSGRVSQQKLFADRNFWSDFYRRLHESGESLRTADKLLGMSSSILQEWLDHPMQDSYWDSVNPPKAAYERIQIPILTITGAYDGDQPGALEHYKQHMCHAAPDARARHYLVIGPWDHGGCASPCAEFDGIEVGSASVIDMLKLHTDWFLWTMGGGPKPELLKDRVTYYVMGSERWRYAATLPEVTGRLMPLYLSSNANPIDVFRSGLLTADAPGSGGPDSYIYDPRDVSLAEFESGLDDDASLTDQRMLHASNGHIFVYHSLPFEKDKEVSGFFRFVAWLSIDQPDADFRITVYEVRLDGTTVFLTSDSLRARYRTSLREATPVRSEEPMPYEFTRFTFIARLIPKRHRLRVIVDSKDSIYQQRNFNGGGVVCEESIHDARPVTVRMFHNAQYPSALYVPLGCEDSQGA